MIEQIKTVNGFVKQNIKEKINQNGFYLIDKNYIQFY